MHLFKQSIRTGVLASLLLVAGASAASASGVRDEKPVTMDPLVVKEAKTHTLFMGADIALNLDKDLYPVRDVIGSSWVIEINREPRIVSAKSAPTNLKITPTLKLTEVSVSISGFKREAAYSYDNDPSVRLTKSLSNSSTMSTDLLDIARDAQARVDTMNNAALAGAAVLAGSDDQFSFNAEFYAAQKRYAELHQTKTGYRGTPIPSDVVGGRPENQNLGIVPMNVAHASNVASSAIDQTLGGNEAVGRLLTRGFDAMEVDFQISSTKPLHNPYIVTMTRFHTVGSKPGTVQNLVYALALNPIDSKFSRVHFTEDGFPFNYELVDFQLHIYDRGIEVATNMAADRVELTRDEAFEYVKSEYIGAHRRATLPAVPVMGSLPADLPVKLNSGKYEQPFFVRVSKEGIGRGAFADEGCSRPIDDPYLASVVERIRFKPALAEGKPVDGVTVVNLAKLTI
ncbi:MAG TPA: hypothetical protein VFE25_15370 [Opitutaceae bacterium]|jgi:hypothetical protein|nr:hypothetical protein [Opitutaceae bacterium]